MADTFRIQQYLPFEGQKEISENFQEQSDVIVLTLNLDDSRYAVCTNIHMHKLPTMEE